jgi:hypothetical protein
MPDEPTQKAAAIPLQERSDSILAGILGRDLMTGTTRLVLFLAAGAAILATIAALAG